MGSELMVSMWWRIVNRGGVPVRCGRLRARHIGAFLLSIGCIKYGAFRNASGAA